jgi:hypothetical protein
MWVVSFTPRLLYPGYKIPGTHWIEGSVGPTVGLETMEKRRNPIITPGENLTPVVQLIA